MSNSNTQDLKEAASTGRDAYSHHSSGKGLTQDDKQKGEHDAQKLYKDYQSEEGGSGKSGSGAKSGSDFVSKAKNFFKN